MAYQQKSYGDEGANVAMGMLQGAQAIGNLYRTTQSIKAADAAIEEDKGVKDAYDYIAQKVGQNGDIAALQGDPIMNTRYGTLAAAKYSSDRAQTEEGRARTLSKLSENNMRAWGQISPLANRAMQAYDAGDMNAFDSLVADISKNSPLPYNITPNKNGNFDVHFRSDAHMGYTPTGNTVSREQAREFLSGMLKGEQKVLVGATGQMLPYSPDFDKMMINYQLATQRSNMENALNPQNDKMAVDSNGNMFSYIVTNSPTDPSAEPIVTMFDHNGKKIDELYGSAFREKYRPVTANTINAEQKYTQAQNPNMAFGTGLSNPSVGIRNNNPMNLTSTQGGFRRFDDPADAFRAYNNQIGLYFQDGRAKTMADVAPIWTPKGDGSNDPAKVNQSIAASIDQMAGVRGAGANIMSKPWDQLNVQERSMYMAAYSTTEVEHDFRNSTDVSNIQNALLGRPTTWAAPGMDKANSPAARREKQTEAMRKENTKFIQDMATGKDENGAKTYDSRMATILESLISNGIGKDQAMAEYQNGMNTLMRRIANENKNATPEQMKAAAQMALYNQISGMLNGNSAPQTGPQGGVKDQTQKDKPGEGTKKKTLLDAAAGKNPPNEGYSPERAHAGMVSGVSGALSGVGGAVGGLFQTYPARELDEYEN